MNKFKKTKYIKINGIECDFTYLTPKIKGNDWGGDNYWFKIHSKKLPSILTVKERVKLTNELIHCYGADFQWNYRESYDNCDYNGAFLETMFIDKNDELTIETANKKMDWILDGDYLVAISKCLGWDLNE